jgi:hypothetical protein
MLVKNDGTVCIAIFSVTGHLATIFPTMMPAPLLTVSFLLFFIGN